MSYDFDVIKLFGAEYYYPCETVPALQTTGWVGGLWVQMNRLHTWRDGSEIRVKRLVEPGTPDKPCFFFRYGSNEPCDQFTSYSPGKTGIATIGVYGQFLFKYYETNNLAERTTPGSGAALNYVLNQDLYVSSRGLITNENETGNARTVGVLIGLPVDNDGYLGIFIGY